MNKSIKQKSLACLSDPELIDHILSGDKDTFKELVARYKRLVQHCVWNYVKKASTVEDLTQEIFIRAFSSLEDLKSPDKFKSWLLRISRNICLDFCKKKEISVTELEKIEICKICSYNHDTSYSINKEIMQEAMTQLPPVTSEILWMRFAENLSYSEMSQITGADETVLRKRVSRGLTTLRNILK